MAPAAVSNKKRPPPASIGEEASELKKPRRSARNKNQDDEDNQTTPLKKGAWPSPLTHQDSTATEQANYNDGTVTPPSQTERIPASQYLSPRRSNGRANSQPSPQNDTQTQPFSQFLAPLSYSYEVEDEEGEGVWGYLLDNFRGGDTLVLRHRRSCPGPMTTKESKEKNTARKAVSKDRYLNEEEEYEASRSGEGNYSAGGYLIGRHPECDRILDSPTVSNRHCIIFPENKNGQKVAVLEDLSGNGTFVNDALVGRNKRRVLQDGDEVGIVDEARFSFRYPRRRDGNGFKQQFSIQEQLGKGHFASVYLCVEKSTGIRYAVKKFEKRVGPGERTKLEGLQQEIGVLMAVSHPSLLCLKATFDEDDGIYLVLELAPEGELFNWIVMKQKLTESETRKVFVQLFQAVKYLHERNIVHRDIKPENILLVDKNLTIKLADFGLAKIIGEESFTTTLCGTPSYVAPEILQSSNHRRYTRAVDVWSLGVVLYICLCGFPPFSDELFDAQNNPYTLAQQILGGRFDYPSPYWDSVGDPALDLIDRMLTVDSDKRITIEECLQHPWTTGREIPPTQVVSTSMSSVDSTDGLVGQFASTLDFSRRKPVRERTLLSSLNEIRVARVINVEQPSQDFTKKHTKAAVKIYDKNEGGKNGNGNGNGTTATAVASPETEEDEAGSGAEEVTPKKPQAKEQRPADNRKVEEFVQMGGKGDQILFQGDSDSNYVSPEKAEEVKEVKEKRKKGGK
ncbi:Pkinase-domain-containing protein [Tothia fuscella]|uniref:Pkinase-domain-containing protein n=1 Tax=Tothia fuscella TaxID=1048955 RepID=A0A9P4P1R6_9PEZI|nr:Pkinase-domain-containing protein [Tothia fuscella]